MHIPFFVKVLPRKLNAQLITNIYDPFILRQRKKFQHEMHYIIVRILFSLRNEFHTNKNIDMKNVFHCLLW